eukprot:4970625-Prymnesium_polylepis.1
MECGLGAQPMLSPRRGDAPQWARCGVDDIGGHQLARSRASRSTTASCCLALVIYTGCKANYAMTAAQLGSDYSAWKVLDYLLSMAIGILSWHVPAFDVPLY